MKKVFVATLVLFVAVLSQGFLSVDGSKDEFKRTKLKKFVGEWKYEAPYAPYGYQEGVFKFTKVKKELQGTVSLGSYETELQGIEADQNVLKFYVTVEGSQVDMELTFDKKTFSGVAHSMQGDIPLTGTKQ